jgi:hypothetical protein
MRPLSSSSSHFGSAMPDTAASRSFGPIVAAVHVGRVTFQCNFPEDRRLLVVTAGLVTNGHARSFPSPPLMGIASLRS